MKSTKLQNIVIGIVFVVIVVSMGYKEWQNTTKPSIIQNDGISIPTTQSPTPTISQDIFTQTTASWKTYINYKFGFSIKYPQNLNLTSFEIFQYQNPKEFAYYINTGDAQPPDWIIVFQNTHQKVPFLVEIYQKPVKYVFGGIEKDGFTFIIWPPPDSYPNPVYETISNEVLANIQYSFSFFKPPTPLGCLWNIEGGVVFDPTNKDSEYPPNNARDKQKLTLLNGFYFDSKTNSCQQTNYLTWKGQEKEDAPPFETNFACSSMCVH